MMGRLRAEIASVTRCFFSVWVNASFEEEAGVSPDFPTIIGGSEVIIKCFAGLAAFAPAEPGCDEILFYLAALMPRGLRLANLRSENELVSWWWKVFMHSAMCLRTWAGIMNLWREADNVFKNQLLRFARS